MCRCEYYCYIFKFDRCPCGPEGFDIGVTREARRRCIGNFEDGAFWGVDDDTECQFSVSARKLCNLAYVCVALFMM